MHGPFSPMILAAIGIPDAKVCLVLAAPFLTILALRWLSRRTEDLVHYFFPHVAWEYKLGWLNIRSMRRADAMMRWLCYLVYATLAAALYGIVWSAEGFSAINQWDDPFVASDLAMRMPVFLVSMGLWLVYLGLDLVPKLRKEYEEDELAKFRAEQAEIEKELAMHPESRLTKKPIKSRTGQPVTRDRLRSRS